MLSREDGIRCPLCKSSVDFALNDYFQLVACTMGSPFYGKCVACPSEYVCYTVQQADDDDFLLVMREVGH